MAKVHFAPNCAVKYVGAESQVFNTSLARPKPKMNKGDILIVDRKTAFNLVQKGFGLFVDVEDIKFIKEEKEAAQRIEELELQVSKLTQEIEQYKAEEEVQEATAETKTSKSFLEKIGLS